MVGWGLVLQPTDVEAQFSELMSAGGLLLVGDRGSEDTRRTAVWAVSSRTPDCGTGGLVTSTSTTGVLPSDRTCSVAELVPSLVGFDFDRFDGTMCERPAVNTCRCTIQFSQRPPTILGTVSSIGQFGSPQVQVCTAEVGEAPSGHTGIWEALSLTSVLAGCVVLLIIIAGLFALFNDWFGRGSGRSASAQEVAKRRVAIERAVAVERAKRERDDTLAEIRAGLGDIGAGAAVGAEEAQQAQERLEEEMTALKVAVEAVGPGYRVELSDPEGEMRRLGEEIEAGGSHEYWEDRAQTEAEAGLNATRETVMQQGTRMGSQMWAERPAYEAEGDRDYGSEAMDRRGA